MAAAADVHKLQPHTLTALASLLQTVQSPCSAVQLLRRAASILAEWRPDTSREYAVVIEHLLMALNRIQAAVDAIIPWNDLDGAVRLRPQS